MSDPVEEPRSLARRMQWLRTPDPILVEFGSGGPAFLLRVRVGVFSGLLLLSLGLQLYGAHRGVWIASTAAAVGLASAVFMAWSARSARSSANHSFVTSVVDPALVTLILVLFALQGHVNTAANSMFIWDLYLIAILFSALQFDPRICVLTGVMASLQYAGLLFWISSTWGLPTKPFDYEGQLYLVQGLRFVLIGFATLGASLMVLRSGRLIRLSGTDALTGLANRALFDQRLVVEVKTAERMQRGLCIVFLDVDHFKRFNDRWGHRAGDDALRVTAGVLREACRESDVIARWGGEEFVVVLPETTRRQAGIVVERIYKRLSETELPRTDGVTRVAVSGGLAVFPDDGEDAMELVAAADQRLLFAKRTGRGRVVSEG